MSQFRRAGFTLIELLVVISIVAMLISILLPALSKARQSAHQAGCQANLRQVGVGAWAYAADNTGRVPIYNSGNADAHTPQKFFSNPIFQKFAIQYLGSGPTLADQTFKGVLRCPGRALAAPKNQTMVGSFIMGHTVTNSATRYNDTAYGTSGWRLRQEGSLALRSDMANFYGGPLTNAAGVATYTAPHPMNVHRGQLLSAYPMLADDTNADGLNAWIAQVQAHGVGRRWNHGSDARPILNVLYGDGSATSQRADSLYIGDYAGFHTTGNSSVFRTWYYPYIRGGNFPVR